MPMLVRITATYAKTRNVPPKLHMYPQNYRCAPKDITGLMISALMTLDHDSVRGSTYYLLLWARVLPCGGQGLHWCPALSFLSTHPSLQRPNLNAGTSVPKSVSKSAMWQLIGDRVADVLTLLAPHSYAPSPLSLCIHATSPFD